MTAHLYRIEDDLPLLNARAVDALLVAFHSWGPDETLEWKRRREA